MDRFKESIVKLENVSLCQRVADLSTSPANRHVSLTHHIYQCYVRPHIALNVTNTEDLVISSESRSLDCSTKRVVEVNNHMEPLPQLTDDEWTIFSYWVEALSSPWRASDATATALIKTSCEEFLELAPAAQIQFVRQALIFQESQHVSHEKQQINPIQVMPVLALYASACGTVFSESALPNAINSPPMVMSEVKRRMTCILQVLLLSAHVADINAAVVAAADHIYAIPCKSSAVDLSSNTITTPALLPLIRGDVTCALELVNFIVQHFPVYCLSPFVVQCLADRRTLHGARAAANFAAGRPLWSHQPCPVWPLHDIWTSTALACHGPSMLTLAHIALQMWEVALSSSNDGNRQQAAWLLSRTSMSLTGYYSTGGDLQSNIRAVLSRNCSAGSTACLDHSAEGGLGAAIASWSGPGQCACCRCSSNSDYFRNRRVR
jgi:hypothetical protein